MKFAFILLGFVFTFGASAQTYTDPCNAENLQFLLAGVENGFHSRVEANDCLKKAKDTGSPVKAIQVDGKNTWGFDFKVGEVTKTRYLKLNKKDFFLTNTLLGKYKVNDSFKKENKAMNKTKFIPAACIEFSTEICEAKTPPQDFDEDYCKCVTKEDSFCNGTKSIVEKNEARTRCEDRSKEHSFDEETCGCSKVTFCGEKKWSKQKKESEIDQCFDKAGYGWEESEDGKICDCKETHDYCGDKKLSMKQKDQEEKKCSDAQTWNPATCICEGNEKKFTCNGRVYDTEDIKACEDKSNDTTTYSWVKEPDCKCIKEKNKVACGGETIGQRKYDRKHARCLELIEKDERYSWEDETECDCIKEKKSKPEKLCGEKKWSQAKYDRKRGRCPEPERNWDAVACECHDPCYEDREFPIEENEICKDIVPKLGDVKVDDLGAKICEKAIPDAEKQNMKDECKKQVDAIFAQSPDKDKLTPIEIEINYTLSGKVICDDKIIVIKSDKEIKHSLPANIPTTDPTKFSNGCPGNASALTSDLKKFHPTAISCSKMADVAAGHKEIVASASEPFDKFFKQLNITPPISKEEMDAILNKANFNLEVLGTANRSNNGTGMTLDELAFERKKEAERVIKDEMTKKLSSMIKGGTYTAPTTLFTNKGGISQAVGPLNPAASNTSMMKVLNEPGSKALHDKCVSTNITIPTAKQLFDCSVDYFMDNECPALATALKERFCNFGANKEKFRADLKAQTTVDFLAEYKMFQIGVDMKTESNVPVVPDNKAIKVKCNAGITNEETTESTTTVTDMLQITRPSFFKRMKKECREERKALVKKYVNDEQGYTRKDIRRAPPVNTNNKEGRKSKNSTSTTTKE